jgi:sulfur carrier protein
VRIQINGEQREFPQDALSLAELIDTLSLAPQRIAVEVNKTIVRRSDWEKTKLNDGDHIEIVHFVGGGEDRPQTAESRRQQSVRNFCSIRERV